ncbi:hypothetical protein Rhein_2592 [Rheinheimera sp. A13L]|uniref:hypothetical protein n=1 Tax=Rheinheimera sp. A13L TaxID=506534 RepID=UPI0002125626|nr:hypothetical protein [Rheinheimera sp. A13L]EGM77310.1 hypothetical protein Rhein_2592 [Rheinheimera sp. A13L]
MSTLIEKALKKYSDRISRGKRKRYISAVAWLNVTQYVKRCFKTISESEFDNVDRFYLNINRDYPIDVLPNHIQIHCGFRKLGAEYDTWEGIRNTISERGAALVFSQLVNGSVLILLYPYKSEIFEFPEQYLIFDRYTCAAEISEKDVEKAFVAFVRYMQATSAFSNTPFRDFVFRTRYRLRDWRYRFVLLGKLKEMISLLKQ